MLRKSSDLRASVVSHVKVCGKEFSMSSHLEDHNYGLKGEKPHQCTVCGKGFRQSSQLTIHSYTHTDDKPYECAVCGKGFSNQSDVMTHYNTHTGKEPHTCTVVERQNGKRGLESGFGSAGYVNGF